MEEIINDTDSSTFDVLNLISGNRIEEHEHLYTQTTQHYSDYLKVSGMSNSKKGFTHLKCAETTLEKLLILHEELLDDERGNINYLTDKCKEKVYELAGQIYAILANYDNNKYYDKAMRYYQRYHIQLQRYKIHKTLEGKDTAVVYSFRNYNLFSLEDLINKTITVVHPSKMNDPFDSVVNLWKKTGNLKKITGGKGHEEIFNKSMDYYRIRSFCANKDTFDTDDDILKKIRMWSHYADNHCGFCIKYRLNKRFFCDIDEEIVHAVRLAPVECVELYHIGDNKNKISLYDAYFIKNKEWEPEQEVRLLSYCTATTDAHYPEPIGNDAQIEEIIFGYLCPEIHMKTIYNLLTTNYKDGVKFYHMVNCLDQNIYGLIKEVYNPMD